MRHSATFGMSKAETKIVKFPPKDLLKSLDEVEVDLNESGKDDDNALSKTIKEILNKKRIKTFKNEYNLGNKLKQSDEASSKIYGNLKGSSQNPYLGSFIETGSPQAKPKETKNFIDPAGDHFGLNTDSNERYNQEL